MNNSTQNEYIVSDWMGNIKVIKSINTFQSAQIYSNESGNSIVNHNNINTSDIMVFDTNEKNLALINNKDLDNITKSHELANTNPDAACYKI